MNINWIKFWQVFLLVGIFSHFSSTLISCKHAMTFRLLISGENVLVGFVHRTRSIHLRLVWLRSAPTTPTNRSKSFRLVKAAFNSKTSQTPSQSPSSWDYRACPIWMSSNSSLKASIRLPMRTIWIGGLSWMSSSKINNSFARCK